MIAKDFMTYSLTQQPVANFVNRLMQFIVNGKVSQRYLMMNYYSADDAENYIVENPDKFDKMTQMNQFLEDRVCIVCFNVSFCI
jgi:hypothetical protein